MQLRHLVIPVLVLLVSYPDHAAGFKSFWVCGRVYDASGNPFPGQEVQVLNRPYGSADPRYVDVNILPGSMTTSDASGRYKIGIETYEGYPINISFFLSVTDSTRQAVLSPRFTVEMETRDPLMNNNNPELHYMYPAVASASAGVQEATIAYDLRCRRLSDVKVLVRREDGGKLGTVHGSISLGPEGLGIDYLRGAVYARTLSNPVPVNGPTAEITVHGILPGYVHDIVYNASDGFGEIIEDHELNGGVRLELNIPPDHYRKIYCRVIDQNNKPINDMQVDLVYMRPWCYSFCSEHDLYTPDADGRVELEWGSKEFLDLFVIFGLGDPVPDEAYVKYETSGEIAEATGAGDIVDDESEPDPDAWLKNTSYKKPLVIIIDRELAEQYRHKQDRQR